MGVFSQCATVTAISIAVAWPVLAEPKEDPDLCVIDRSGHRNGIWNTCYSILGPRAGPDEAIVCDSGILGGEGYCRILPRAICTLVEGAGTRDGVTICQVSADIDDPDWGFIGWRPVRSLKAQEPVLKMVDWILLSASSVGEDRVVAALSQGREQLEKLNFEAGRLEPDETDAEPCRVTKNVFRNLELMAPNFFSKESMTSANPELSETYDSYCMNAVVCLASSFVFQPPMIDGLEQSVSMINRLECPKYDVYKEARTAMGISEDPVGRAIDDATYGPAYVAATNLMFNGESMSDADLLEARTAIHAHLIPEFQQKPSIIDIPLVQALHGASTLHGVNGLLLESIVLDLLARRRGTSLPEIAGILFPNGQ